MFGDDDHVLVLLFHHNWRGDNDNVVSQSGSSEFFVGWVLEHIQFSVHAMGTYFDLVTALTSYVSPTH